MRPHVPDHSEYQLTSVQQVLDNIESIPAVAVEELAVGPWVLPASTSSNVGNSRLKLMERAECVLHCAASKQAGIIAESIHEKNDTLQEISSPCGLILV